MVRTYMYVRLTGRKWEPGGRKGWKIVKLKDKWVAVPLKNISKAFHLKTAESLESSVLISATQAGEE